jgi:hypothetical protein
MIPRKHLWRKQVQLSLHTAEIARLDKLSAQDWKQSGGRQNRSATVIRLVDAELKRREAASVKTAAT